MRYYGNAETDIASQHTIGCRARIATTNFHTFLLGITVWYALSAGTTRYFLQLLPG